MDISITGSVLPSRPGHTDLDDEGLANKLSFMSLALGEDNEAEMASGASNGNFIPQALSTPGPAHSHSHPFTPSLLPCRKLSRAPAITQGSHTSCRALSQPPPMPPAPTAISPHGLVPTPPTTCKPTLMSSLSLSEELLAEFITQCALLPVNVLATFSPVIQVAVPVFRASTTTSELIVPPTTTTTTPAPTWMRRPLVKAQAKPPLAKVAKVKEAIAKVTALPTSEPFDADKFLSDVPSASESNLPINPKQSSTSKPPSKQKTMKLAISKSTGKKMQAKTVPPIVEDDEPVPKAPVQQAVMKSRGGKGKAATKVNGTGQTVPDEETPIGVATGAGAGGKAAKAVKAVKAVSTGAKGSAGGKATAGKIDGGGAGSSKLTEPVGKEPVKRVTRANNLTKKGASAK
ncbi:hypothetical protein FRC11_012882 [Ceratobasidium sp. 423]|nr:hypothetical protein FRC11_012882 [Ceratobasidium sp. 423]